MSAPKTERNNAMVKYALHGYSFEKISKLFGISISTARAITFRELRKVAPNLKDYSMRSLRPYKGIILDLVNKKRKYGGRKNHGIKKCSCKTKKCNHRTA